MLSSLQLRTKENSSVGARLTLGTKLTVGVKLGAVLVEGENDTVGFALGEKSSQSIILLMPVDVVVFTMSQPGQLEEM